MDVYKVQNRMNICVYDEDLILDQLEDEIKKNHNFQIKENVERIQIDLRFLKCFNTHYENNIEKLISFYRGKKVNISIVILKGIQKLIEQSFLRKLVTITDNPYNDMKDQTDDMIKFERELLWEPFE